MSEDRFNPPEQPILGVIGLGYVGLPLAVEFGQHLQTIGYDTSSRRIEQLRNGVDHTREAGPEKLAAAKHLQYTANSKELARCNTYIVTVPTPVDAHKTPDLSPLIDASETIGTVLGQGDVVIYESTVYPGATEDVCVPALERTSGLTCNRDFFVGYSPERINPGDPEHGFTTITKVTAGSTPKTADYVDGLYASVVKAGTHKASSIRVAEAAKVIENIQRDVNIALVNELAQLFNRLDIDTDEVLRAAGTKWNFLPFRPGLVGGHCIGVDPYYLTYKAQQVGHHPEMILAGRRVNDGMGAYIAERTIQQMLRQQINPVDARVLVLGLAFKENCPDLRNTRVVDIVHTLREYNARVDVCDPWVDAEEAEQQYGITPLAAVDKPGVYDAIILAVPHAEFVEQRAEAIRTLGRENSVLFDVKAVFPAAASNLRL